MKNQTPTIAYVDDEEDAHIIFNEIFKPETTSQMLTVFNFLNGKACIEFLRNNPRLKLSLIITDLNMPVMDGFSLIELVKKEFPNIKTFVLSAYNAQAQINRALNLGADKFLSKPINFKKLKENIIKEFSL